MTNVPPRIPSLRFLAAAAFSCSILSLSASVTDAVVSKSPPNLNQGRVKGSVRVMTGGNFNINSGLTVDGSLVLPGTPEIRVNGGATSPIIQDSTGSAQPSNYRLTLNNGISLGGITRRVDGEALPTATIPATGTGTRHVHINQPSDSAGDFATVRTLTLNAQGSTVSLPPGRYERITVNGASTVVLQAGSATSPALYEIQQLDLNGGSRIDVAGPVELRLKNSFNANGYLGHSSHPEWLAMSISSGSFTLNSQSAFHGKLVVPTGTLTVNGSSLLHGMAFTERLTLNGGGVIECEASGSTPNLPPVATASEATTPIGAPVEIPLLATDPEGQTLSYTVTASPAHGTVAISGATATYTPDLGFTGTDIFYFRASDGTSNSAPAAVVIHVWQPNRPPSVEDTVFLINQGEANAPLTLNATDPDGDAVTYQILTQPQHGVLGGSAPALTYAHTGARSTTVIEDSFTFRVVDSEGAASTVGTITLSLQPVNRTPQAAGLAVTTAEDQSVPVSLPATDEDGDSLTYAVHLPESFPGTITGTAPALEFIPTANFHGTTSFTYDVTDPAGATASAAVEITVTPVNDAPVIAGAISVSGDEDQPIAILLEASDVDGDGLTYTWSLPEGFPGTLSGDAPSLVFTPEPDFSGTATFDFTVTDPSGLAVTSQVNITVRAANDAPVAENARATTRQGTALNLPLPVNDADADPLTFTITSYPLHGTMVIADGKAIYMPDAGFSGVDRFRYTAHDGTVDSTPADVIIRVAANPIVSVVSPAPGARVTGNQPITVKVEASDADSDLSFVELLLDGTRVGSGTTGTLELALENLSGGQHTLSATAVDAGGGRSVSQPVTFSVEAVNLAPLVAAGADRTTTLDSLGPNLLANPGNEQALVNGTIPGWTSVGTAVWGQGKADSRKRNYTFSSQNIYPAAIAGSVYFHVTGDQTGELFQDIELTESQRTAAAGGVARFAFEARSFTYQPVQQLPQDYTGRPTADYPTGELDRPEAVIEFYNQAGQLLASQAAASSLIGDRWLKFGAGAPVPASTTRARVRLIATKADSKDQGGNIFYGMTPAEKNDALFDEVSFKFGSPADEFLSAAVSDDGLPAGSTLAKLWTQVSGPTAAIAEPDKSTTPVHFSAPGDYEFKMEADDSELTAADIVKVHVDRPTPNLPPVVSAGADVTTDFLNKTIPLTGSATDESTDLVIGWTQVSGPGKATFANGLAASTTISVSLPGTYLLKLAAFDGEFSSEDLVTINATATAQRRPLDLVLTMDHSSSMWALKADGDPTIPIAKAREAAAMVLSKLDPATDRAAMRKFNGPMITPLTFDLTSVKNSLVQTRGEPGVEGGFQPSNIDNGIQGALSHIQATPRTGAPDRAILVFNDGAGPYSDVAAKAARAAGIRVIVISFSNGIDAIDTTNMQQQASVPGDAISAETPAEAVVLLNNLLETLRLPLNSPPQVNAGAGIRLANTSEQAYLKGTFSDDGEPGLVAPAILWEQVSGPVSATFSDPHKLDPRVSFTAAGEYRFRLSVNDGERTGSDILLVQIAHPIGLPAPSGLTSWWPFDGNLRDMVGNRHLTRYGFWNSPSFTTSPLNNAVQLLDSPDVLSGGTVGEIGLNSAAGFSIELRFRAKSLTGGYLFSLFNPTTGFVNHGISWGRPGSTSSGGQLYFLSPPASANSGYSDLALTSTALSINTWHHAILTHNRSNNETWLYLNGQGQRVFTNVIAPFFPATNLLHVGGMPAIPGFSPATAKDAYRRFDGDIDDLAFYSRPLSMGEAGQLYQSSSTGGKQPPTIDRAPVVDAGIDLRVSGLAASLNGLVSDDTTGVKSLWSQVSGPGTATFADASSPDTAVTFDVAGIYTLKLTATDAVTSTSDLMQVHVGLPAATAAPDGLVAWMPGNRHPMDLIMGRTGIWSGTESYAPVKAGDGFQFGGSLSRVRYLPPAVAPADTGRGFSIETWMSLPATAGVSGPHILSFQNVAGNNVHRLQLTEFTLSSGAKEAGILWRTSIPSGGFIDVIQIRPVPLNRPFHLALTYDPVTLRKKAFIDGVQVADFATTAGMYHHFDKECFVGSFPGETPIFPGQIDELSLYNVALTQPQILAIAQAGSSGKYLSPPAADPRVDAGSDVALAPGESHTFAPSITTGAFTAGPLSTVWTKISGPGSVTFNQSSRSDATVTVSQAGRHVVRLTVTDGVTTVSDEVTLDVVTLPNAAPVITALPASVTVQLPQQVNFEPQVSDDGRPNGLLEKRWITLDGPAPVTFTATSSSTTQATFTTEGDYTLVFEVSDGLATTRQEIPVHVVAAPLPPSPNQVPVVSAGDDFEADTASFSLTGTVTDDGKPANQPLIHGWSLVSGPGDVTFGSTSALTTTASVSVPGAYRLRLAAFDGELAAADEVVVTVPSTATGFPNKAPRVALPPFLAGSLPNLNVTLQPAVEDDGRSGQPLTYAWVQLDGPAVAEIVTPTEATTAIHFAVDGEYLFELAVSDGEFSAIARTTIQVNPSNNHAPVLTMAPAASARPYDQATLAATVNDDGNPSGNLTYRWAQIAGPEAVVIANPNSLETPVTFGAGGSYLFELLVSDGQLSTRGTVVWNVIGVPDVHVISPGPDDLLSANTLMTVQGRAQIDGGTITSLSFEVDGQVLGQGVLIPETIDWILTLPSLAPGEHTIVARATSSDGQQAASAPQLFTVGEQRVDDFLVEIHSPEYSDSITGQVDVSCTVQAKRLTSWTLTLTPTAPEGAPATGTPVVIATGTQPVNQDVLGSIDPSLMLNGVYTLKLSATTQFGSTSSDSIPVLIEGNKKIGHFSLAFEDLSIPVGGVPLTVTRTYDSRDSQPGDFGPGWSVGFSSVKVRKAGRLGEGWEQEQTISGITPIYSVYPVTKKRVVVTFPGGKTETFEPVFRASSPISEDRPNFQQFAEMSEGTLVFKAINGSEGTLEIDGDSSVIWNGPVPGRGTVIDFTFNPIDSRRFRYTSPDDTAYVIDEIQGLVSQEDRNGNNLTISRNGLVHSSGDSVLFTRNGSGRITEITDPAGEKIFYGYDTAGRLQSVTSRTGEVTSFYYENAAFPNYLTRITDPRGIDAIRTEFDDDGRMVRQIDAAGNSIEFEHDIAENREVVRDRLGNVTIHEYDDRGNVVETTDALGGVTSYTYDANDNETSITTPLGLVTSRTYDSNNNLLSETNPAGHVTTYTYDTKRRPLTIADPLGLTTTLEYDGVGNLISMTDPANAATTIYYDGSGNVSGIVDPSGRGEGSDYDSKGRIISDSRGNYYSYDAAGNQIQKRRNRFAYDPEEPDPGIITTYEYDTSGRLTRTVLPNGSTSQTIYNTIGKPAKTIDAAGRETLYTYDTVGHLVSTTYPDGTVTSSAYDIEGRQTAITDAAGLTTYTLYDALGRATAVILPDETMPATVLSEVADIAAAPALANNPRRTTTYDADGRVTASTDEHGQVTTFEYDDAGRRTAVVNALNQRTTTAYDAAGRQTSATDAKGITTGFEYNASGHLTRTNFADGTFTETVYDAAGRRILSTDQEGNSTEYAYTFEGQLLYVIDAEGFYTEYEYDSQQRQIAQLTLSGYTQYRYDDLGRRIARRMPDGNEEHFSYDLLGRLAEHEDFNGHITTREYAPLNDRLLAVIADASHPSLELDHAPARHEFGYDNVGRRTSATVKNAAGAVLHTDSWSYDLNSRPLVQASTTGTLRYAWDATGTLAGAKSDTTGGYDLSYDYDALGRLTTAYQGQEGVDPTSQAIAAYAYDANGNLAGTSYINQVTHAYAYNSLNRLTNLAVDRQAGGSGGIATPLQGYTYTLNAAGHRTGISELGGRTIEHTFDRLYRLNREMITTEGDDSDTRIGTIAYGYDAVGNHLYRYTNDWNYVAGRPLSAFVPSHGRYYNYRDQASGESYDANGNTTVSETKGSSGSPTSANDIYSFDNRLIRRTRGDGLVVDVLYNTDGDRVAKWVKQGSLNLSIHRYLVDRTNLTGYAQVVEERDGSGELVSCHLYGHDLIAFDDWITRVNGFPERLSTPERRWYQYDGLGSVRGLSNDDGVLVEEYTYEAFGTLIGLRQLDPATSQLVTQDPNSLASLTNNRYLFTGEQWDPDLGMYFLRARYLNPNTGRFHTEDTYEGRNDEPLTLHKYLYANSNPVTFIDPTGQFTASQGYRVESLVRDAYRSDYPSNTARDGRMTKLGDRVKWALGGVFYLKPDIFDTDRKIWMEVKPFSIAGIAAAAAQHGIYTFGFAAFDYEPDGEWVPDGHSVFDSNTGETYYIFNVGGILFYSDIRENMEDVLALGALSLANEAARKSLLRILLVSAAKPSKLGGTSLRYAFQAASRAANMAVQSLSNMMKSTSARQARYGL